MKNDQINKILSEMTDLLCLFGFHQTAVNNIINYECGGQLYRLTPMCKNKTILLEVAESYSCALSNGYEDAAWYDFPKSSVIRGYLSDEEKNEYLNRYRADIVLYYAKDNFDTYMISNGFDKKIVDNTVKYIKNCAEVYYDYAGKIILQISEKENIYELTISHFEPSETIDTLKKFVKQYVSL